MTNPNDEFMKAVEDIQTGKVEEKVIWEKGKTVSLEELPDGIALYPNPDGTIDIQEVDPLEHAVRSGDIEETPLTGALDIVTKFRDHEEDHEKCWCTKKLPLLVHGHEVGVAVPLANGDYSLQFDNSNAGRLVRTLIDMGTENSFSIVDDKGVLDLGEED